MIPRPNPRLSRKTKAVGSLGGTPTRPYGFLRGDLCGFFCPWLAPAGGWAFGRGPVRATPATPVCGHLRREGVARRRQKPCVVARGELSSPPFLWRSKERGRGGSGGAQPPRSGVGLPCVSCYDPNKNHLHGTALLDCDTALITATRHAASLQTPKIPTRAFASGRALATLGTAPTKNAIANLAN